MSDNNLNDDDRLLTIPANTLSALFPHELKHDIVPIGHDHNATVFVHEFGMTWDSKSSVRHKSADMLVTMVETDEHIISRLAALKAALDRGENTTTDDEELETIVGLLMDRCMQGGSPMPFICDHCLQQRQRFGLPRI